MSDRYVLVPVEPTEEMWTAGREPIMARDCIRDNWSAGDHVREAFGAPPAWMRADELNLRHVSKGMAAVWTYRAMIASALPVGEDVRADLIEIAENAIDNVHDMDVSLKDYATAAVDAILDTLATSTGE